MCVCVFVACNKRDTFREGAPFMSLSRRTGVQFGLHLFWPLESGRPLLAQHWRNVGGRTDWRLSAPKSIDYFDYHWRIAHCNRQWRRAQVTAPATSWPDWVQPHACSVNFLSLSLSLVCITTTPRLVSEVIYDCFDRSIWHWRDTNASVIYQVGARAG